MLAEFVRIRCLAFGISPRWIDEPGILLEQRLHLLDFECAFVGDGPDRQRLGEQAARAGLGSRVAFLGRRTRADVVRLLGEADVLVAPSVPSRDGRREGIPVAIMEGAACGIPVVASDLSGIPELIEDGKHGRLVPPGDAVALA